MVFDLTFITGIFAGVINGAGIAILGYLKNMKTDNQDFDPAKALQTLIVGGVVGAGAGYVGLSYAEFAVIAESTGIITVIEYIKKTAWALIKPKPVTPTPVPEPTPVAVVV